MKRVSTLNSFSLHILPLNFAFIACIMPVGRRAFAFACLTLLFLMGQLITRRSCRLKRTSTARSDTSTKQTASTDFAKSGEEVLEYIFRNWFPRPLEAVMHQEKLIADSAMEHGDDKQIHAKLKTRQISSLLDSIWEDLYQPSSSEPKNIKIPQTCNK